jgi:tetratricopeptide (TPR) repeat protein
MAQVFLSYARDDVGKAKALAAAIERAGFSVWWDRDLEGGAEYSREIDDALKAADVVVVLWSKDSVGSAWVRDEAAAGRDSGRLVPARIDPSEPPLGFRQYQTINLSRWNGRSDSPGLKTLKSAIAGKVGRGRGAVQPTAPEVGAPLWSEGKRLARALVVLLLIATAVGGAFWYFGPDKGNVPTIAIVGAADAADRRASEALARTLSVDIGSLQTAATNLFELRDTDSKAGSRTDYVVKVAAPQGGKLVSADLSLLSQPASQILWTSHLEQPAENYANLRLQATTRLAAVLACLMEASPASGRQLDEMSLKLYLRGCEKSGDQYGELPDPSRLRLFQQVVERFPRFAPALAHLASLEANAGLNQAARQHLSEARRLNPRLGKIYMAETALLPRSQWGERQAILERGLEMNPDDAELHASMAFELSQVGRMNEGVESARRALEIDPLSPIVRATYVQELSNAGRFEEAENELKEGEKIWPASAMMADTRYAFDLRIGDPANALRMLRENQDYGSTAAPAVELFLRARIDPTPQNIDKAIDAYMTRFRQAPSEASGIGMLLSLGIFGRTDQAYEVLAHPAVLRALPEQPLILFKPYMRGIRHDHRFMPLAARLGLVRYWTETNKWPDFCLDADLPYDCKREAAKYSSKR